MYESFYGLKEKPFSLQPDPGFLFLGKRHGLALTMLEYGLLNRAPISLITGEIGSGKTTLIRKLLDGQLGDVVVGLISNTHAAFGELMEWVLTAFDITAPARDKASMHRAFVDYLIDVYAGGRRALLIVDEAQNLDAAALEEFRLLSNVNADKDQLLQLVLVGQPELRTQLRAPGLEQFVQRISVDYHIAPLAPEETDAYIAHRLRVAGGDRDIFTRTACRFIHLQAGGVPRLINQLCDTALVYGFAEQSHRIDAPLVFEIVVERINEGLFGAGKRITGESPEQALERARAAYAQAVAEVESGFAA